MRFLIEGRRYDAVDISRLTMKDMLQFEQQTAELGRRLTWADVTRWYNEMAAMPTDAAREKHPEVLWLTAVSIWAARNAAGEALTFEQAIDIPASDIKILPDTEDHQKPAGKAKPRKASGAAVKHPASVSK